MGKHSVKRKGAPVAQPVDDSGTDEEFDTSDEEEINAAMADPALKKKLLSSMRGRRAGEDSEEDDDESDEGDEGDEGDRHEDSFIYAGEVMKELCADVTWGDADEQWKEGLVLTSKQRTEVEDVENDLERELAFYNQALQSTFAAITRFEEEGVKWRRPDDYLAEMVKSDGHMAKVKEQLVHEQTVIEEAEQRRKDRETRKYSKQVAAERRKERSQQKKQAIDSVTNLRKQRAKSNFQGDLDLDQVGLGDAKGRGKGKRLGERFSASGAKSTKRQKRDSKFGFGGPKRRQKMNDAFSAAATEGPKRAGGPKAGGVKKRPGKSRRAAQKNRR